MIQVQYIDHMGHDLRTVDAARVSMKKRSEWGLRSCALCGQEGDAVNVCPSTPACTLETYLTNKDERLVDYLGRHHHKSPFNHNALTVYVKAPIFVARQLVKHEYLVINEVSRRYVDDELEFYFPEAYRKRAPDKKQGSLDEEVHHQGIPMWNEEVVTESQIAYNSMLSAGVAPEQARMILPQNLMTEWYWTGLLAAWGKMVNLRIQEDAQYETRNVALKVDAIARELWPHSWEALRKYNVK